MVPSVKSIMIIIIIIIIIIVIIIIIIINRGYKCKARRERVRPYQSEDRRKRTYWQNDKKGKTGEDKKVASSLGQ